MRSEQAVLTPKSQQNQELFLPEHGGAIKAASRHFNIPASEWLDLSTGIAAQSWPVPEIPAEYFNRLPEDSAELNLAIATYYGQKHYLAAAGSQTFIQHLPTAFKNYLSEKKELTENSAPLKVALISPSYSEHFNAWNFAGYQVERFDSIQTLQTAFITVDFKAVIIVNPGNPSGQLLSKAELLELREILTQQNTWLIIDEAFIDATPSASLLTQSNLSNLLVLRSVGKFFGLPGIRAGFLFGDPQFLPHIQPYIGPWSLSGPAQFICEQALLDTPWQQKQIQRLDSNNQKLTELLQQLNLQNVTLNTLTLNTQCKMFVSITSADDSQLTSIYHQACLNGLLLRLFPKEKLLRIGHPSTDQEWDRLDSFLSSINT